MLQGRSFSLKSIRNSSNVSHFSLKGLISFGSGGEGTGRAGRCPTAMRHATAAAAVLSLLACGPEDLAGLLASWGLGVRVHPWVFAGGDDAAVMVSGNAMAHVYLDLAARTRPWWPALEAKWGGIVQQLLARESVDLMLLPRSPSVCEVRSRTRGTALVRRDDARYSYEPLTGDPLGLRGDLGSSGALHGLSSEEVHAATFDTDYPDSLVQIIALAGAARSGEIILSAARDWDFRAKYEPIPHVSAHGALHREHLLVPLILSRGATGTPRRTTDVFPSALQAMGRAVPDGLDGVSFR